MGVLNIESMSIIIPIPTKSKWLEAGSKGRKAGLGKRSEESYAPL